MELTPCFGGWSSSYCMSQYKGRRTGRKGIGEKVKGQKKRERQRDRRRERGRREGETERMEREGEGWGESE